MKPYKFILSGGGTGGHIYPAIAIANELKAKYPNAQFLFVGAKDRMEMQKVPKAGYEIKGLWISGIQRSLSIKNLVFPLKLIVSIAKSYRIIKQFKPDLVVGTGGFASAPLLRVAAFYNIPTLIQEQNSYAGIANKWLSKHVNIICVAYADMQRYFPKSKLVVTGNPVRQDIVINNDMRLQALHKYEFNENKKTVLVLGGSLGAKRINELIESNLDFFEENNLQLLWQCGSNYYKTYQKHNHRNGLKVVDFIHQMNLAYALADVVISRAGALSVSELSLVGKPVIFIPSPNVAENHQYKNAQAVAKDKAALLIEEKDLEPHFKNKFLALLNDEELQKSLSVNIKKIAKPKATSQIVSQIEKLLNT